MSFRSVLSSAFLISTLAVSSLAAADPAPRAPAAAPHAKAAKVHFPLSAAEFRPMVNTRVEAARQRLEAHITKRKLTDAKAAAARARFQEAVNKVEQEVAKVSADGTVSKAEARGVWNVARALRNAHRPAR